MQLRELKNLSISNFSYRARRIFDTCCYCGSLRKVVGACNDFPEWSPSDAGGGGVCVTCVCVCGDLSPGGAEVPLERPSLTFQRRRVNNAVTAVGERAPLACWSWSVSAVRCVCPASCARASFAPPPAGQGPMDPGESRLVPVVLNFDLCVFRWNVMTFYWHRSFFLLNFYELTKYT